jgi:hypothetical protein
VRIVIACLLVAACATTPPTAPPERLAGCWIGRTDEGVTTTMRWLPDRARSGVIEGQWLEYHRDPAENRYSRYTLEPRGETWIMCSHWQTSPVCREVAEGEGGSLEGGRVFIDAHGESLRISEIVEGLEEVIFDGRRDGCD